MEPSAKMEEMQKQLMSLSPDDAEKISKMSNTYMLYMLEGQNDGIETPTAIKEFAAKKMKEKYTPEEVALFNSTIGGMMSMMKEVLEQVGPTPI